MFVRPLSALLLTLAACAAQRPVTVAASPSTPPPIAPVDAGPPLNAPAASADALHAAARASWPDDADDHCTSRAMTLASIDVAPRFTLRAPCH